MGVRRGVVVSDIGGRLGERARSQGRAERVRSTDRRPLTAREPPDAREQEEAERDRAELPP